MKSKAKPMAKKAAAKAKPAAKKTSMPKKHDGMWIQAAIKHPGSLHKDLHVPAGKKIPKAKLKKAAKAKGKEGKRARLAITLSTLRKNK